jgi:dethiobiotin synthetase
MAAEALGLAIPTLDELEAELVWSEPPPTVGWVETVGGPRSPMAADGDAADLCHRLDPDTVVLVANAGLGTVNAVTLSVAPFAGRELVVVLNRFDPGDDLHVRNREWLRTRQGLGVVTGPEALVDVLVPGVSPRSAPRG